MQRKLNVLVACESSAVVRDAFRKLGHNAYSCDLLPCDGNPRYHIQGDVLHLLKSGLGHIQGRPDGTASVFRSWDLLIAHPPCTYLCNSGVRWLYRWFAAGQRPHGQVCGVGLGERRNADGSFGAAFPLRYRVLDDPRWKAMREGAHFFADLYNYGKQIVGHVAVENPIMHGHAQKILFARSVRPTKPTQIIQPWQFGHGETKATGLWLYGLPELKPTDVVSGREHRIHKLPPSKDRWKLRSKTYKGIADAMAGQWSEYLCSR